MRRARGPARANPGAERDGVTRSEIQRPPDRCIPSAARPAAEHFRRPSGRPAGRLRPSSSPSSISRGRHTGNQHHPASRIGREPALARDQNMPGTSIDGTDRGTAQAGTSTAGNLHRPGTCIDRKLHWRGTSGGPGPVPDRGTAPVSGPAGGPADQHQSGTSGGRGSGIPTGPAPVRGQRRPAPAASGPLGLPQDKLNRFKLT